MTESTAAWALLGRRVVMICLTIVSESDQRERVKPIPRAPQPCLPFNPNYPLRCFFPRFRRRLAALSQRRPR